MNDFFQELGKQLAARWLSLLAVPGALYVAACLIAAQLGQAHALQVHRLIDALNTLGTHESHRPAMTQALTLIAFLLAASAIGLVVQALSGPVRALCLGQWPRGAGFLADRLAERRNRRWHALLDQRRGLEARTPKSARTSTEQREIDRIAGRMNAMSRAEPGRPTWMGDRIHALSQVAVNRYGLDLEFGWSRLWLTLPSDRVREEISAAQSTFAAAVYTFTWSVPYLILAAWWWPSAAVAVVIAATGRQRCRAGIDLLADLVEAVIDTDGRTLAIALGVAPPDSTGPLTPDEGQSITQIVRKGR